MEYNRSNPDFFIGRGKTYLSTRTYTYARNDFSMALDLDPGNPQTYLDKGIAELNLGNSKAACYAFKRAYDLGLYKAGEYLEKYCK